MRKRDDEKQERIKQAVMETILKEGFAGASISKIARKAGVSPATVYIYYDNKDAMLRDIYLEYTERSYHYLSAQIATQMSGADLIRTIMSGYYHFIRNNQEVFSFIEQFANCPALSCTCSQERDTTHLYGIINEKKKRGEIRNYSNESIENLLFSPVRTIAARAFVSEESRARQLREVMDLIEKALLPVQAGEVDKDRG